MPYTGDNFVRVFGRKMHSKTEKSMRSTLGFSKLNKSLSCSLTQDTSLEGFMGMLSTDSTVGYICFLF